MDTMSDKNSNTEQQMYQCSECGLWYVEEEWKEKCEIWCRENKSCNLEIIKHSVVRDVAGEYN